MNFKGVVAGIALMCTAVAGSAQDRYYHGRNNRQWRQDMPQQPMDAGGMSDDLYNNNSIFSFSPIQITENGVGMGVAWERNLDRYGWVAFNMPAMITFNLANDRYTGLAKNDPMFYLMPGIKIYTNLNSPYMTKYAIGPSLVIGAGRGTLSHENSGYYYASEKRGRFLLGAMGNISANLFPTPHLYLGAEYGLGFAYINQYGDFNKGVGLLTQLSLRIGYTYTSRRFLQ
ncbi:MAG: hypothetical protein V4649_07495 [Bacteroidota bacterium]